MIIYFSKLNLNSTHLLEMYKKEELIDNMRKSILSYFSHGTVYEEESLFKDELGEVHVVKTKYKLTLGLRKDEYITGIIYKSTILYYKELNEKTGEVEFRTIPTIEDVKFYFDIYREMIGFHTRNRFGYQEFNNAFANIINTCMNANNSELKFSVDLYNEGMEIGEIERELKQISNIKKLEFRFRLPNPADEYMVDELKDGLTDTAEQLEDANAHSLSIIFDSDGKIGLNVESGEIKRNINRVGHLTQGVDDKSAVQNGYAFVKATSKDGKIYTTEESKPIKREITDDESGETFFKACRDTILSIFTQKRPESREG